MSCSTNGWRSDVSDDVKLTLPRRVMGDGHESPAHQFHDHMPDAGRLLGMRLSRRPFIHDVCRRTADKTPHHGHAQPGTAMDSVSDGARGRAAGGAEHEVGSWRLRLVDGEGILTTLVTCAGALEHGRRN